MLSRRNLRLVIPIWLVWLVFVLPIAQVLPAQREYLFTAETRFTVLSGPWDIKSADLDDDGYMDLVTANRYSGSVTVALNSGVGSFDDIWNYPVGYKPWEVALADLDGDGDEDIAVTLTDLEVVGPPKDDYDLVAVLFNDGEGAFSDKVLYPVGNEPRTVFLADLGEDGNNDIDMITGNEQDTSSVSVLFNDGFGNFSEAVNYSLGIEPRALYVGDLNGDGFNDAVTANHINDNITVLFNDGSGNFGNFTDIPVGSGPWDVHIENVTGNSGKDIIVLNRYDGTIEFQENDGTGNFSWQAYYSIDNNSVYLLVGDADLDGHSDVMCSSLDHDLLTILFYNVTTSSYQKIERTVDGGPRSFVLADLDVGRPGMMNIATANVGGNSVAILISNVPPTIQTEDPYFLNETEVRIEWKSYDPDSDASIELFYYRSGHVIDAILLATFSEDQDEGFYIWNVSSVDEGDYQFTITISDELTTVVHHFGLITVEREPPPSDGTDTGPSLGLIAVAIIGVALMIIVFIFLFKKKPEPAGAKPTEEELQNQSSTDGLSGGS